MTREQKVSTLIQYLKQENQGYASIPDPIDEGEQRRLLRSLMNVRYPGHASAEYEKLQDVTKMSACLSYLVSLF